MTLGDAKLGNSLTLMVWKIAYTAKQNVLHLARRCCQGCAGVLDLPDSGW